MALVDIKLDEELLMAFPLLSTTEHMNGPSATTATTATTAKTTISELSKFHLQEQLECTKKWTPLLMETLPIPVARALPKETMMMMLMMAYQGAGAPQMRLGSERWPSFSEDTKKIGSQR